MRLSVVGYKQRACNLAIMNDQWNAVIGCCVVIRGCDDDAIRYHDNRQCVCSLVVVSRDLYSRYDWCMQNIRATDMSLIVIRVLCRGNIPEFWME